MLLCSPPPPRIRALRNRWSRSVHSTGSAQASLANRPKGGGDRRPSMYPRRMWIALFFWGGGTKRPSSLREGRKVSWRAKELAPLRSRELRAFGEAWSWWAPGKESAASISRANLSRGAGETLNSPGAP